MLDPTAVRLPDARRQDTVPTGNLPSIVTAGALAHHVQPMGFGALCDEARDVFEHNEALFALPVVDRSNRPVGLVNRFKFLERFAARFGRELTARKPLSAFMDPEPLILEVDTNIDELGSRFLAQQERYVLDGFIVTSVG